MKPFPAARVALRRAAILLALTVLAAAARAGTTVYVSPEGDDGNAGTASAPKATIQAGINAAGNDGTVLLAAGTYSGTGNAPVNVSAIIGDITIRALDGASPCIDCGKQRFVSIPNNTASGLTLEGLTIQNGAAAADGGAVRISRGATGTFDRCLFRDNHATSGGSGGAVALEGDAIGTFTSCRFLGNSSDHAGGAVFSIRMVTLTGCTFEGNHATDQGGAAFALSIATVTDCWFIHNGATSGGALSNLASSATPSTFTRCVFYGNRGANGMAFQFGSSADGVATDCTFVRNAFDGTATGAYDGGAVDGFLESHLTLKNCTIAGNTSTAADPATRQRTGVVAAGSSVVLTNCIVRVHSGESAILGRATVTYSDVQGGYAGTGNIDVDPRFVNAVLGDYHLLPNSLCVDAGTSSAVSLGDTDLDGHPRIFGPAPDMGAYELFLSNVTDQLTGTRGAWTYDRSSGTYTQPLTLTNAGADITTPLYLVFANLTGGTVVGPRTRNLTPTGAPYQILSSNGLTHGSSLTVTVTIHATSGPIAYTPLVYTGNGTP